MKVLITGGTGSLGSKLVPHFLGKGFDVRVLSRDEDKQSMMMRETKAEFVLGDIRNKDDCLRAVHGCDVVIHAAALKRIEFGEMFPFQFIQTNILGTKNMVEAAKVARVRGFIFISTDKAVEAVNAYGMTKALAEKLVTNANYNCVRYGNVNNSRGSVLPYWKDCKEKGLPITVTNPFMTRFLIDFKQAIELIDIALKGKMNGDIYIPKLDAANIGDIAKLFISRQVESKVIFSKERRGEKLREILINEDEYRNRTEDKGEYFIVHKDLRPNLFKIQTNDKGMRMEYSSETTKLLKGKELKNRLREFI